MEAPVRAMARTMKRIGFAWTCETSGGTVMAMSQQENLIEQIHCIEELMACAEAQTSRGDAKVGGDGA